MAAIESRTRNKIKAIGFADIHLPGAKLSTAEFPAQFDAVASFGVLSPASNTMEQYKNALKNLVSLVKPGGFLIYTDILQPEKKSGDHGHGHSGHSHDHGHSEHGHSGHGHSHGHEHGNPTGHNSGGFKPHGVPLGAEKVKPELTALGVKVLSWKEFEFWGEGLGEFMVLGQCAT